MSTVTSPDGTVIDYDRRGRGRSGDTQPWALDREVEDLAALITAVGGAAALCTNSSGADITLAAASAGTEVTALALYLLQQVAVRS